MIARIRLPRHPEANELVDAASERYAIECDVATMEFLQDNVKTVPAPKLYAYEPTESENARRVGACYMLIEGFYGNTLQDVEFDVYGLSVRQLVEHCLCCRLRTNTAFTQPPTRERIITQWTVVQAELASFSFPTVGSICSYSKESGATIGKLACAVAESYPTGGPFATAQEFFLAAAEAHYAEVKASVSSGPEGSSDKGKEEGQDEEESQDEEEAEGWRTLGPYIFLSIVKETRIFASGAGNAGPFHLNHMDMGSQNILVDDDLHLIAVIDWEFAQAAPVQVNHYPMPFPLLSSDVRITSILSDPKHIAYPATSAQDETRKLYRQKFVEAEQSLAKQGRPLQQSIAKQLDGPASTTFAVAEDLMDADGQREDRVLEMVRLAFGFERQRAKEYIKDMEIKMNAEDPATKVAGASPVYA